MSQLRTPALILKEQAEALTKLTDGVLEGRVSTTNQGDGDLRHRLQIVAPLLSNYVYTVATIAHGITLYPLVYSDQAQNIQYGCASEVELKDFLKKTITSATVKNAIAGLLVQSRQTDDAIPF